MQSKSFYAQHKEEIEKEVVEYKAHQEKTPVGKDRCAHKTVTIQANTLRCTCGAVWQGPRIEELYKLFIKGGSYGREK